VAGVLLHYVLVLLYFVHQSTTKLAFFFLRVIGILIQKIVHFDYVGFFSGLRTDFGDVIIVRIFVISVFIDEI